MNNVSLSASRLLFFICCVCSLMSCKKTTSVDADTKIILSECKTIATIKYDDSKFIESWSMVELEADKGIMIGNIRQLHLFEDRIYIVDRQSNALYVFNIDGSFSHRIGVQGRGPQEYLSLKSFYINPDKKEITLFDAMQRNRALVFDLSGKFVVHKEVSKEVDAASLTNVRFIGNGRLVCYADPNSMSEDVLFVLNEEDMTVIDRLAMRPIKTDASYSTATQPYSIVDGKLHFVRLFDNKIYEWSNGRVTPLVEVDSGKPLVPENLLETVAENHSGNYFRAIAQLVDGGKYSVGLKNLFETSRFIFCEFANDSSFTNDFLIWDKKSDSSTLVTDPSMIIPGINNVVFSSGDKLVSYWSYRWINGFRSWLKNSENADTSMIDSKILEMLQNYDAALDNPVLFIYDMKK